MNKILLTSILGLTGLISMLPSCTTGGLVQLQPFDIESISLKAVPGMNNDNPVPVDIIFVHEKEDLKDLEGFSAATWFTIKKTQLRDWEEELKILSLAMEPGQERLLSEFPEGYEKALGIVIYANYSTPGLHRLVFRNQEQIEVLFQKGTIESDSGKPYLLTSPAKPLRDEQARRY